MLFLKGVASAGRNLQSSARPKDFWESIFFRCRNLRRSVMVDGRRPRNRPDGLFLSKILHFLLLEVWWSFIVFWTFRVLIDYRHDRLQSFCMCEAKLWRSSATPMLLPPTRSCCITLGFVYQTSCWTFLAPWNVPSRKTYAPLPCWNIK